MNKQLIRQNLFLAIIIFLVCIAFISWRYISSLPTPWRNTIEFSTRVTDQSGHSLRYFTSQDGFWRFPAQIKKIDKRFINALIAYEDKRFYQHFGVDLFALIRAVKQLVVSSRIVSGASTLSMQTIRLLNPQPRTIKNKLIEMIQSIRMESELSKNQILALYLNLAPYGGNIQGIEAASYFYFGKSARYFNPSEIALLIALPQSPEKRRPDRNLLQAQKARNHVLKQQKDNKLITDSEYQLAIKLPIKTSRYKLPFYAPHLSQRLHSQYPRLQQINSSIKLPLQILLQQKIKQYRTDLGEKQTIAAIIVDNSSNQVVAHMGSANYFSDSQIDISRVIRSPGSTLKPFIYGLGFEYKLFHPLTEVMDRRIRFADGYSPQNFDNVYYGQVTLHTALLKSLNIPAVLALKKVGISRFIQRIKSLGIDLHLQSEQEAGLAIALGGSGLSLENLVSMYAALANNGTYRPLSYLSGKEIKEGKRLLSHLGSYYVDQILKKMPQDPQNTGEAIRYKTGTSYGYRDAWSIGYNSQYTIGIWVGRADGGFTHDQTGSRVATPILKQLFSLLPENSSFIKTISKPEQLISNARQLPLHMRKLDNLTQAYQSVNSMDKPYILYPLDGSEIEIQSITNKTSGNLILKAAGGKLPYHWMINGQYLTNSKSEIQWPVNNGIQKITLIDSLGRQSYSQVRIKILN